MHDLQIVFISISLSNVIDPSIYLDIYPSILMPALAVLYAILIIFIAANEATNSQPQSQELIPLVDAQIPTSIENRVEPYTLKYRRRDLDLGHNGSYQGNQFNGIVPYDLKYDPRHSDSASHATSSGQLLTRAVEPANQNGIYTDTLNINYQPSSFHLRPSTPSTIQTNSAPTVRQIQLQTEADDLREQVRALQNALDHSNEGMQAAMNRMMSHIQSLENQINSDWARGLSEEAPPGYESV
ncbi:hypothetical protein VKT23_004975 [Stygiomarasmius scandens]|uniref:Uncharacterized protein n=1 Tax=Marasmiellus scandens TaxID=2682957 RepID=A0ABR1JV10_9AGAR